MKSIVIASISIVSMWAGPALAQCTSVPGLTAQLVLLNRLVGHTICGRPGAGYLGSATDRWQEQHRGSYTLNSPTGSGELWDYKLGASPMDPTEQVGTWSINGNGTGSATITHSYTGGSSYTYKVFNTGGVLSFCTAAPTVPEGVQMVVARFQAGIAAACSSYP